MPAPVEPEQENRLQGKGRGGEPQEVEQQAPPSLQEDQKEHQQRQLNGARQNDERTDREQARDAGQAMEREQLYQTQTQDLNRGSAAQKQRALAEQDPQEQEHKERNRHQHAQQQDLGQNRRDEQSPETEAKQQQEQEEEQRQEQEQEQQEQELEQEQEQEPRQTRKQEQEQTRERIPEQEQDQEQEQEQKLPSEQALEHGLEEEQVSQQQEQEPASEPANRQKHAQASAGPARRREEVQQQHKAEGEGQAKEKQRGGQRSMWADESGGEEEQVRHSEGRWEENHYQDSDGDATEQAEADRTDARDNEAGVEGLDTRDRTDCERGADGTDDEGAQTEDSGMADHDDSADGDRTDQAADGTHAHEQRSGVAGANVGIEHETGEDDYRSEHARDVIQPIDSEAKDRIFEQRLERLSQKSGFLRQIVGIQQSRDRFEQAIRPVVTAREEKRKAEAADERDRRRCETEAKLHQQRSEAEAKRQERQASQAKDRPPHNPNRRQTWRDKKQPQSAVGAVPRGNRENPGRRDSVPADSRAVRGRGQNQYLQALAKSLRDTVHTARKKAQLDHQQAEDQSVDHTEPQCSKQRKSTRRATGGRDKRRARGGAPSATDKARIQATELRLKRNGISAKGKGESLTRRSKAASSACHRSDNPRPRAPARIAQPLYVPPSSRKVASNKASTVGKEGKVANNEAAMIGREGQVAGDKSTRRVKERGKSGKQSKKRTGNADVVSGSALVEETHKIKSTDLRQGSTRNSVRGEREAMRKAEEKRRMKAYYQQQAEERRAEERRAEESADERSAENDAKAEPDARTVYSDTRRIGRDSRSQERRQTQGKRNSRTRYKAPERGVADTDQNYDGRDDIGGRRRGSVERRGMGYCGRDDDAPERGQTTHDGGSSTWHGDGAVSDRRHRDPNFVGGRSSNVAQGGRRREPDKRSAQRQCDVDRRTLSDGPFQYDDHHNARSRPKKSRARTPERNREPRTDPRQAHKGQKPVKPRTASTPRSKTNARQRRRRQDDQEFGEDEDIVHDNSVLAAPPTRGSERERSGSSVKQATRKSRKPGKKLKARNEATGVTTTRDVAPSLLILNIETPNGIKQLAVFEDDDAESVARRFCEKYAMDIDLLPAMTRHIQNNIKAVANRLVLTGPV